MAKAEKVTKAEYLDKHEGKGPAAMARLIIAENPKLKVSPQEISTMKSKLKAEANGETAERPRSVLAVDERRLPDRRACHHRRPSRIPTLVRPSPGQGRFGHVRQVGHAPAGPVSGGSFCVKPVARGGNMGRRQLTETGVGFVLACQPEDVPKRATAWRTPSPGSRKRRKCGESFFQRSLSLGGRGAWLRGRLGLAAIEEAVEWSGRCYECPHAIRTLRSRNARISC